MSSPSASTYKVAITSVRFTGKAMRCLEESEFLAVCGLGTALNDLGLLKRAMLASAGFPETTNVERNIGCSQFLFFARLHLSKMHEALIVIDQIWRTLATRYESMLPKDAQRAVKYLMRYKKDKSTLVNIVRNRFEFHFPMPHLRDAGMLDEFVDADIFSMYAHETRLNSFYFGSSMIVINYLLKELGNSIDECGLNKMMKHFMNENVQLDSKIHAFGEGLLACIFDRIDKQIEKIQCDTQELDCHLRGELQMPFFIDTDSVQDEEF